MPDHPHALAAAVAPIAITPSAHASAAIDAPHMPPTADADDTALLFADSTTRLAGRIAFEPIGAHADTPTTTPIGAAPTAHHPSRGAISIAALALTPFLLRRPEHA